MKTSFELQAEKSIVHWIDHNRQQTLDLLLELIRIPSENRPPHGGERPVQLLIHDYLQAIGFASELYDLADVQPLSQHPAYWHGRDYRNRPNLFSVKKGRGGGKSLLFSVHADVVPGIEGLHPPFSPIFKDGRVYGRGSSDMKGGIAAALTACRFLQENGIALKGDLLFESVVDEEMGGSNGTLAGRLRGNVADAAIIPEPTGLKVCSRHLGGITWRIVVKGKGGMGFGGEQLINPIYGMARIVAEIEAIHEEMKQRASADAEGGRPGIVVSIARGGDFEPGMADGVPASCLIEVWVECLPGDTKEKLEREFKQRIEQLCRQESMRHYEVEWEQTTRFIPGSEAHTELTDLLVGFASAESGKPAQAHTAQFGCDAFMFNLHSSTPAIILGPSGQNAHGADEFVDMESIHQLVKIYIEAILRWCAVSGKDE